MAGKRSPASVTEQICTSVCVRYIFPKSMCNFLFLFFFFAKNDLVMENYCCYKYGYCYYCSPGKMEAFIWCCALSFGVLLDRGIGDNDESPFTLSTCSEQSGSLFSR